MIAKDDEYEINKKAYTNVGLSVCKDLYSILHLV